MSGWIILPLYDLLLVLNNLLNYYYLWRRILWSHKFVCWLVTLLFMLVVISWKLEIWFSWNLAQLHYYIWEVVVKFQGQNHRPENREISTIAQQRFKTSSPNFADWHIGLREVMLAWNMTCHKSRWRPGGVYIPWVLCSYITVAFNSWRCSWLAYLTRSSNL